MADTKYVLQYRTRAKRGQRGSEWNDTESFSDVGEAIVKQKECIAAETFGTKDWRVRVVAG